MKTKKWSTVGRNKKIKIIIAKIFQENSIAKRKESIRDLMI